VQASSRWHSSPVAHRQIHMDLTGSYWVLATAVFCAVTQCVIQRAVRRCLVGNYCFCLQCSCSSFLNKAWMLCNSTFYPGTSCGRLLIYCRRRQQVPPICCSYLHYTTSQNIPSNHNIHHTKNVKSHRQVQWKVVTFLTSEVPVISLQSTTHCSMDKTTLPYLTFFA
jgi:hypothetical protein